MTVTRLRLSAPFLHNRDAEQGILGSLLQDGGAKLLPRAAILTPDSFADARHSRLFREMSDRHAAGRRFDAVTLKLWSENDLIFNQSGDGGAEYLAALMDCAVAGPLTFTGRVELVAKLELQRQWQDLGDDLDDPDMVREAHRIITATQAIGADAVADDNLISGVDLMAIEFPPAVQFIEDFIVAGLTMIISKPKVGKSWLILDNGLAIAGGWDALGGLKTERSEVLLLMLEDSQQRVQSRLRKLLAGKPCPPGLTFSTKWPKGDAAVEKVRAYLDRHPGCRVVGVDLWAKVRGEPGRASIYNDDYGALEAWQQLAQERGVAIVMVHHARKADADDIVDSVSGTLGASGAVDHLVMIKGSREAGYEISLTGRDLLPRDWIASLDDGQWTLLGDKPYGKKALDKVERIDRNNKIREAHASGESQKAIARKLGVSPSTVHTVIHASEA